MRYTIYVYKRILWLFFLLFFLFFFWGAKRIHPFWFIKVHNPFENKYSLRNYWIHEKALCVVLTCRKLTKLICVSHPLYVRVNMYVYCCTKEVDSNSTSNFFKFFFLKFASFNTTCV